MRKILLLSIINIIISITAQGQITPFWQTFPGYDNKATFRTEDGLAVIGMKLNEVYPNIYARNKLHRTRYAGTCQGLSLQYHNHTQYF